ncbi:hypothetical protein ACVWW5_004956 [Bradyrhizobium sp. LM3.4]
MPMLALRRGALWRGKAVARGICRARCRRCILRYGGQRRAGNDAAREGGYELCGAVAHPGLPITPDATRYLPFVVKDLGGNEPRIRRGCGLNRACAAFVPPRNQTFSLRLLAQGLGSAAAVRAAEGSEAAAGTEGREPGREHGCGFPRQVLPESCFCSSPNGGQRAQGRPGAGGTRWSVRDKSAHGVDRWGGRSPGLPCADGFNGVPSCSPRGAMHYCPRRPADD